MGEFDPGPPQPFNDLFDACPDYTPFRDHFWFDWGPVFYRGRLDGSARVLCIASDPGATERIAGRTLVGDAGQRVQGFLAKLGLTRSYLCLNAFSYALIPSEGSAGNTIVKNAELTAWRNQVFDAAKGPNLQAVVAFGRFAQKALALWPGRDGLEIVNIPHPTSRVEKVLLDAWRGAVVDLRAVVTPDPDGNPATPNYGTKFKETDYAPVPARDLPFGVPAWLGDNAPGRKAVPPQRSSVTRPKPDDRHTLHWIAPKT
jgi:uracil-DNA glycosylase